MISCENNNKKQENNNKTALAIINSDVYTQSDFNEFIIGNMVLKDTQKVKNMLIEKWAQNQLLYNEAIEKLKDEEIDIEKKVESYKRDLIIQEYIQKLIEANLDTNVSKQEIENYYSTNSNNFILMDNIVKVNYYKIPLKVSQLEKIKKLIHSQNSKDFEQLKTMSSQYAESFFANDSTWLYLENIKKEIPKLAEQPDISFTNGKIFEFSDDLYYYYLKIKDEKIKNSISPMNLQTQNIKNFIINERKVQLISQYKQQLYQNSLKQKTLILK